MGCRWNELLFGEVRSKVPPRVAKQQITGRGASLNGQLDAMVAFSHEVIINESGVVGRSQGARSRAGIKSVGLGLGEGPRNRS